MKRVQQVEKVVARRTFVFGIRVREVLLELLVLPELRVQLPDRELVVVRDLDLQHLRLFEQVLLVAEHRAQEVFVDARLVGQIVLDWR